MSTALTHLAAARERPNLTVRSETVVDRIELSGTGAAGALLPPRDLAEIGNRAFPRAGRARHRGPRRPARRRRRAGRSPTGGGRPAHAPGYTGPRFQTLLTTRSSNADPESPPDLHLFAAGPFDDAASPTGGAFGVVTALLSPSSTGTVRLRSADPDDPPRIEVAYLRTADDLRRMVDATRHARGLARTPPLAGFVQGPELAPGAAIDDDDDDGLGASIRARVGSYNHPVGTCAMGARPTHGAVVDSTGAVHGTDGLWVADASVIPSLLGVNPNLTAMVVGDRIASWLLDQ